MPGLAQIRIANVKYSFNTLCHKALTPISVTLYDRSTIVPLALSCPACTAPSGCVQRFHGCACNSAGCDKQIFAPGRHALMLDARLRRRLK